MADFQVEYAKKENIQLSYEKTLELSRKLQIVRIQLNTALNDIK